MNNTETTAAPRNTEEQMVRCVVDRIMASAPCPPIKELGMKCLLDERLLAGQKRGYACRDCWQSAIQRCTSVALAERVVEQSDEPAYDPRDCEAADDPR